MELTVANKALMKTLYQDDHLEDSCLCACTKKNNLASLFDHACSLAAIQIVAGIKNTLLIVRVG